MHTQCTAKQARFPPSICDVLDEDDIVCPDVNHEPFRRVNASTVKRKRIIWQDCTHMYNEHTPLLA